MVLHGQDFFRVEGRFRVEEKWEQVVAKVIPGKQKVFERNKKPYQRLVEHIGLLPVVMIVPDDTRLATEGSEERRRFVNNTLSQLHWSYLEQLMRYNKVLKQRNALLKSWGGQVRMDDALLLTYEAQLAAPAAVIYEYRKAFTANFLPIFQQYYQVISGGQEEVELTYKTALEGQELAALFAASRAKDCLLQRTTVGIHKDEWVFRINGYPLKRFASQGQLKSFILAMRLAQYEFIRQEKNISPILLLDDIFDKLDRHRVQQLIQLLMEQNFGQVCITDTHMDRLADIIRPFNISYQQYRIDQGQANLMA